MLWRRFKGEGRKNKKELSYAESSCSVLILSVGVSAFASEKCENRAVTLARTNSSFAKVASFSEMPVAKDYLLGYRVELVSSDGRKSDSFRIIPMKSSCSTVSFIREI